MISSYHHAVLSRLKKYASVIQRCVIRLTLCAQLMKENIKRILELAVLHMLVNVTKQRVHLEQSHHAQQTETLSEWKIILAVLVSHANVTNVKHQKNVKMVGNTTMLKMTAAVLLEHVFLQRHAFMKASDMSLEAYGKMIFVLNVNARTLQIQMENMKQFAPPLNVEHAALVTPSFRLLENVVAIAYLACVTMVAICSLSVKLGHLEHAVHALVKLTL